MALTKQDLQQIAHLIRVEISGLKEDVSELKEEFGMFKEAVYGLKEDVTVIQQEIKRLDYKIDDQFFALNDHITENTKLFSVYANDCATKKEHQALVSRVDRVEAKVGV